MEVGECSYQEQEEVKEEEKVEEKKGKKVPEREEEVKGKRGFDCFLLAISVRQGDKKPIKTVRRSIKSQEGANLSSRWDFSR